MKTFTVTHTGRILSLAWHEPEQVIVTGGIDNLRVWSLKSGHALHRLTPGRMASRSETIVWAVAITRCVRNYGNYDMCMKLSILKKCLIKCKV